MTPARGVALAAAAVLAVGLGCRPAAAAGFSPDEGFTADGKYQWAVELGMYGYLPHIDASVGGLGPRGGVGTSSSVTAANLVEALQGGFFGDGLVRYGPWSAEYNVAWVDLAKKTSVSVPALGRSVGLKASMSLVMVTAGVGYEVFRGALDSVPASVDVRGGVQYLYVNPKLSTDANIVGGASADLSATVPWVGLRGAIYPSEKWRVEFIGNLGGLGVDDGSVNWATTLQVSYLVTDWFDLTFGVSAVGLNRMRHHDTLLGTTTQQSIHLLMVGPVIGAAVRF
jgi:hypothetical protein